jgi:hypothetical protein
MLNTHNKNINSCHTDYTVEQIGVSYCSINLHDTAFKIKCAPFTYHAVSFHENAF